MNDKLKTIRINSFNCRGLRNPNKRGNIFQWLKNSYMGITLLQESHSANIDGVKWEKEWEGKVYYSHGEYNARGVTILIPKELETSINILETHNDSEGRILLIKCVIENNPYTIINIYSPTKDNLNGQNKFLLELKEIIELHSDENLIIGGDFNTCIDPNKDKKGGKEEKQTSYTNNLVSICEEYSLVDLWRVRNPDKKQYTRRERSRNGVVHSRLDYWLISTSISYLVKTTTINIGNSSDHSLISITLDLTETQQRGKGFWKFNNSLLCDTEYIQIVKDIISEIQSDQSIENKNVLWEFTKCKIRTHTMAYASKKAKERNKREKELEQQLNKLQTEIVNNDTKYEEYVSYKTEWEELLNYKANGIKLRAKAKWTEEGEKNTKYFLNLDKRNANSNYIKKLIDKDNKEIVELKEIINEEVKYYKELYTSKVKTTSETKDIENDFLTDENIPQLNNLEKSLCDSPLTIEECSMALKQLSNNKSPGSDGFTTNFYKFFWIDIKDMVYESYIFSKTYKILTQNQKLGILNLLPKQGKDLRYLKNWRPVSLLNTDYKILAKTLANRLHKVIAKLVNSDQVGYIKQRYIGENIRLIFDIMSYTTEAQLDAIIAQIDFEKAFDSIEWPFLMEALKKYNFGEEFISWISLLYTDIQSCVGNNGYYSKFFTLSRYIRQGCPISVLLFILVAEIKQ